jgi:hypothetical protein
LAKRMTKAIPLMTASSNSALPWVMYCCMVGTTCVVDMIDVLLLCRSCLMAIVRILDIFIRHSGCTILLRLRHNPFHSPAT